VYLKKCETGEEKKEENVKERRKDKRQKGN
jgi:hypothetical protein